MKVAVLGIVALAVAVPGCLAAAPRTSPSQLTNPPSASPVVISGVDMIKAADERELTKLADVILIGRPLTPPRPYDIGDDMLVDYFVDVAVEQVLKGRTTGETVAVQWLGVSPDVDNYVAEPDLAPLDELMAPDQHYLLFLFEADLAQTYNVVGHLNGLYPISQDGTLEARDGGFGAFAGRSIADLPSYLDELGR